MISIERARLLRKKCVRTFVAYADFSEGEFIRLSRAVGPGISFEAEVELEIVEPRHVRVDALGLKLLGQILVMLL